MFDLVHNRHGNRTSVVVVIVFYDVAAKVSSIAQQLEKNRWDSPVIKRSWPRPESRRVSWITILTCAGLSSGRTLLNLVKPLRVIVMEKKTMPAFVFFSRAYFGGGHLSCCCQLLWSIHFFLYFYFTLWKQRQSTSTVCPTILIYFLTVLCAHTFAVAHTHTHIHTNWNVK